MGQTIALVPGRYGISAMARADGIAGVTVSKLAIICLISDGQQRVIPVPVKWTGARDGWKRGFGAFIIDANCPGQDLVWSIGNIRDPSITIAIDDVKIDSLQ